MKHLCINALSVAALLAASAASAQGEADCARDCLSGYVDSYFQALAANDPAGVPLADDVKITENGQRKELGATFWDGAEAAEYRWDIMDPRGGDTATEAVVGNADGSVTMLMVRLKVRDDAITEVETIKANEGDAGFLWGPENLTDRDLSPALQLTIREADRDSHYGLIAAAESYWRAFQSNGTDDYHPADLLPDASRYENGLQTTGLVRDGEYRSAAAGFDQGNFVGRNLWDRRYPVVDRERGIVLSIVRFGLKDGSESQSAATTNDRVVAEFFAVKNGQIQEIHAVLFNLPDAEPTGWEPEYGPGRGGW